MSRVKLIQIMIRNMIDFGYIQSLMMILILDDPNLYWIAVMNGLRSEVSASNMNKVVSSKIT